ncbi:hypothetical protein [Paenibacillus sp. SYP-B4298]|uniref:hypothetical protein n=1 Tax=Paenibacillus sp. SYP-B4298 TaxID=2996034 RepID=UPI0022DDB261|nr:hypothetical protein [Paenibacillus sp. SYP-B4298]
MNGMSYQPGFQASQASFNQQNQFQPQGYVQSQYRGQIPTQNAGPVISHLGYQAGQQGQIGQQYGMQNSQMGMGQAQTQYQPVISHLGYQAGRDYYPQAVQHNSMMQSQQQPYAQQNSQYASQPVIAHFGGYSINSQGAQNQASYNTGYQNQSFQPAHAQTQQNPVLNATNAHAQDGPVLAHLGYQAGNNAQFGQNGMNRF